MLPDWVDAPWFVALTWLMFGLGVGCTVGRRHRRPPPPPKHRHQFTLWKQTPLKIWDGGKIVAYRSIQKRTCSDCGWEQWDDLPAQL